MKRAFLLPILFFVPTHSHYSCATRAVQQPPETAAAPVQQEDEAAKLNAQIVNLYREGKYDEALPLAEHVAELWEKAYGASDPRVAKALGNVGELLIARKDYVRAEQFYQRALAIYDGSHEGGAQSLVVLKRLFFLHVSARDFDKADATSQRIVSATEATHGAESVETALALVPRADLFNYADQPKKAEEVYVRLLSIAEKLPASSVPTDLTKALANYVGVLYARGENSEDVARLGRLMVAISEANPRPSGGTVEGGSLAGKAVEGGVLNGNAVHREKPIYPALALGNGKSGIVIVHVLVDQAGRVVEAKAISGSPDPPLRQAAEQAARRWRFTPTLLSGIPVKVTGTITFNFIYPHR